MRYPATDRVRSLPAALALLLLAATPAVADVANLFPQTATPSGDVTSPNEALTDNGTGALVTPNGPNTSNLVLSAFDNAGLGAISDVTVWVEYLTTAPPGNDTYQFDVAVDGATFSTTVVAATTLDQPAYVTASVSLGPITPAEVATLAVRCLTNKQGGVDGYSVDWDVGYIVVTHTPAGGDTLTVTQTGVPSVDVQQGATLKLLQVLDLIVDANSATLTDLTVTRLGTAVDADTTASGIRLWHDVNDDDTWDAGDAQLSTSKTFSGGGVTFDTIGFTTTAGTPEKLLVTADIAAAGSSTEGNTLGSSIDVLGDIVVSAPDTVVAATPLDGDTHTITDSGDTLTVDQTSTGGGTLTKNTTNNVVMVLDLTADNDSVSLSDLTVTRTGAAGEGDTTASGIKLWHDVNNSDSWDGGDAQLSTSKTFSGGSVTFDAIGFATTAGTPEKLLITYDIAVGAGNNTIGARIDNAGQIAVGGPDSANLAATPLTGDSFTIADAGDTLTVTQTNVPSADVQQGVTLKLLQVLDLSVDANDATLTDLTVTRLGTAVDADTTASSIRLWHDVNNDDTWDAGDAQLSTSKTFSGGSVAFDAIGFTTTAGTPEKLLVTADIAAAGSSSEDNTIGSSINAGGDVVLSGGDVVSISAPLGGNLHTITDSGDQLTIGQTATGGGTLTKGTANNTVMVLDLTADNDSVPLTDLTVTRTGSAVPADTEAAGIKLWHDLNNSNSWDGGDLQLSTSKTFAAGSVTFDAIGFTVAAGTPEKLLITYDITAPAGDNTIGAQIDNVGQVTVGSPDSAGLTLTPLTGDVFTLADATGDTLTASNNVPSQTLDPFAGQTGVVMQFFQVDSDSAGDGSVELSSITVEDLGTAVAGDWGALEIYIDDDAGWDNAALIGQVLSWNGALTSVPLTQGTPADRTVTAGTPKFVFVVYDIDTGAAGKTIQSQITVVDVQAPDNGHSGLDLRSLDPPLAIVEPTPDSTTVESNAADRSSCRQITVTSVLTGDANDDGSTLVEFNTVNDFTGGQSVACAAVNGPSPRQCLITGDSVAQLASGDYWVRVTHNDPDTVLGAVLNPQTLGAVALEACGTDASAPTVLILAPARGAVLGGTDRVKIQVYDEIGLAAVDPVRWSVDGAVVAATGVSTNANYEGTYCAAPQCRTYEFDLNTSGLQDGLHYLTIEVTDAATPTANVAVIHRGFSSRNLGATQPGGSGLLLRRSHGSQLCTDCHNLPTHSSQTTSTDYGNWAVECLDCHTPHATQNIFLVRKTLRTPKSGTKTVAFHYDDDLVAGETNPGDLPGDNPARLSFLGDRSQTDGGTPNAPFDDGICESCHTKTKFWRNTVDENHTHNAATRCMKCHVHDTGFSGGGGSCLGCHSNVGDIGVGDTNDRRPVLANFDNFTGGGEPRSHHVGNSGTNMGGTLTDYDCVVCHAEGRVDSTSGETETVAAFHGGDGGDTAINLKNVDTWDDDNPLPAAMFTYDKEAAGMPSKLSPETWNSSNAEWRNQTSTALDPFCLTCHDTDGAVAAFNSTDSGSALNPFGDDIITNEYDQVPREYAVPPTAPGRVVDIKSMVTADGANDWDGFCSTALTPCRDAGDCPGAETCDDLSLRQAQSIPDPLKGIYSRHAIRGQAQSTYVAYESIGGANDYTMYEGDPGFGASLLVQRYCDTGASIGHPCTSAADCNGGTCGPVQTDEFSNPLWNDTSVMGCADCHTTDGANGSLGNAHGSDSEYLLKDVDGFATEGDHDNLTYVCYRCHASGRYQGSADHTGSSSDWRDTVLAEGVADRRDAGKGSSIFGMACMNCHGGTGPDKSGNVMWGTIHGSSEVLGVTLNGGAAGDRREAYRFMNGATLRYYDPQGWAGTAVTCYTLTSGDDWGGCTQHDKAGGQDFSNPEKPLQRPLAY